MLQLASKKKENITMLYKFVCVFTMKCWKFSVYVVLDVLVCACKYV